MDRKLNLWAGNKVAMWRTADPHTGVQIPPRPLKFTILFEIIFIASVYYP